jgi:DNA-binding SARP family transcriptional activator
MLSPRLPRMLRPHPALGNKASGLDGLRQMPDRDDSLASAPAGYALKLFGAPALLRHGTRVPLGARPRALIAYLALQPECRAPRDRLMGLFWEDRGEDQARGSLRQSLLEVRRAAPGLLEASRSEVWFPHGAPPSDWSTLAAAMARGHAAALADGLRAIGMSPLLEGLEFGEAFDGWLLATRAQVENGLGSAVRAAMAEARRRDGGDAALALADLWLAREPRDEPVVADAIALELARDAKAAAQRRLRQLEEALARDDMGRPGSTVLAAFETRPAPLPDPPLRPAADPPSAAPPNAEAAATASLRPVTTLVCELDISSPGEAPPETEDLVAVAAELQPACARIVEEHGGVVGAQQDQGLVAHFGMMRGDEEAAVHAVRAAAALRAWTAARSTDGSIPVAVRQGIASGRVYVSAGGAGSAGQVPALIGAAPQEARRLAAHAGRGEILLSPVTARIVDGLYACTDAGLADAPGAVAVIEAREAGSRSQARAMRAILRPIGRDIELARLARLWERAREGHGQMALIVGEAGIGKSTLVRAALDAAGPSVVPVVRWQCVPGDETRALRPIVAWLRAHLAAMRPPGGASAAPLPQAPADWLDDIPGEMREGLEDLVGLSQQARGPRTAERMREQALDAVLALLERMDAHAPLLLAAEDLHWADPSTLELMRMVAARAGARRWLVLATARPGFRHDWDAVADVVSIGLEALPARDARALAGRIDREQRLPPDVVMRALDRAGGNPLFIEEMLNSLLSAAAAGRARSDALTVPETLLDALVARLDQAEDTGHVAALGAAIGAEFSFRLLAEVADLGGAELRQALRGLARARVIEVFGAPPDSRYRFRHALLRDAAEQMLPRPDRMALHGRIARALEARPHDVAATEPARLARHLFESGNAAAAVPLWAAAAQQCAARAAYLEASTLFRHALAALDASEGGAAGSDDTRLRLLTGLAVSLSAVRGFSDPAVGDVLSEAREICDRVGGDSSLFPVMRGLLAFWIMRSEHGRASELADRLLAMAERSGRMEERINAHTSVGYIAWLRGQLATARRHLDHVVSLYLGSDARTLPRLFPMDQLLMATSALEPTCRDQGDEARAREVARLLEAQTASFGEGFDAAAGLNYRSFNALLGGDNHAALALADQTAALCEAQGYTSFRLYARLNRAAAAALLGDREAGIAVLEAAIAEAERAGQRIMLCHFIGTLGRLLALSGRAAEGLTRLDLARRLAEDSGERVWLPRIFLWRAEALGIAGPGRGSERRAALEEALAEARAQGALLHARAAEAMLGPVTA